MAVENFITYTEVDPNSRITVTSTRVTWTDLDRNERGQVYKDKGVDFFNGAFVHTLTLKITAIGSGVFMGIWHLRNTVADFPGANPTLHLGCSLGFGNDFRLTLQSIDSGGAVSDFTALDFNTNYYLTITRDEALGSFGRVSCKIYTDAARTTLLDTITVDVGVKSDFRYIYVLNSENGIFEDSEVSGYTEGLNISTFTNAASVTTQAPSGVTVNTATGNGNITNLGNPPATQHGHVWATHTLPTTEDGIKENGVPTSTGAYTSSIIDLIPNTLYYYRAFIINSVGTIYGSLVSFTTVTAPPVISDNLELTTNLATEVATTTAVGNGSISNSGGSPITQHGVVWSISANPDTSDSKTEEGANTVLGRFSSLMTGLNPGTLYHFRAYAINATGTGYGPDVTFTTLDAGAPIVVTRNTINIRETTATGVGNIIDLGGAPVTQHGHVWGTSLNPTTGDSKTTLGTGSVGAFTSDMTALTGSSTYYVRAYATNSFGTAYGNNDIIHPTSTWTNTRRLLSGIGEHLVYTSDATGTQRALLGVPF